MATASFTKTKSGIEGRLITMLERAKDPRPILNTSVVNLYKKDQAERWETKNSSETGEWDPINSKYAEYKTKKYSSYIGNGRKLLVATGKLLNAATMRSSDGYKILTTSGITFGISLGNVPYAGYVSEKRPFMQFSDKSKDEMITIIRDYMVGT